MNKSLSGLKKISRILKIPTRVSEPVVFLRRDKKVRMGKFHHLLAKHLRVLDSGVELLDYQFPIQEGDSQIDFIACNNMGELIFVWSHEVLKADRFFRLIAQYDWARKNIALWQHLFPQVKKDQWLRLKVWLFCRKVAPEVPSVLSYLKEIRLHIFEARSMKKGDDLTLEIQPWSGPREKAELHFSKPPELPSITQEEVKDLMADDPASENGVFGDEDEITDPFIHLSELKMKN
jgi:hypothetical protein